MESLAESGLAGPRVGPLCVWAVMLSAGLAESCSPVPVAGVRVGVWHPRMLALGPGGPELGPVRPPARSPLGGDGEVRVRGC